QKTLLEALAVEPRNVRALNALGHLREISGEKELALAHYEQSLQVNQKQPELALRVSALRNELRVAQSTSPTQVSSNPWVPRTNRVR
ncbi:MAG TPA: hypothetical protein PLD05_03605, partial [Thermogutta sp.]|nr:hypothetical protein [Thermogutta sp.]HPU06690.1 hypothetical protein [Thermogutta sp.]